MRGRLIAGLILVLVGVGLLLDARHLIDFGTLAGTYWPLILILIGLVYVVTRSGAPLGGIILILVGAFFLARNLHVLPANLGSYVWPAVLIVLGILVLFAPRRRRHHGMRGAWGPTESSEATISRSAFLGGFEERVHARPFRGGHVDTFMGGAKLDLRDATLPAEGADIEASATLGGIEILVPPTWRVAVSGSPFLGGIDVRAAQPTDPNAPVLRIKASAFLGGVDVKN